MKRKRKVDQANDLQTCDLILTDASGRSIRVHKALLIDKSDYFAEVLRENDIQELQLDEKYLIELIHYLYNHEVEDVQHSDWHYSQDLAYDNLTSNANIAFGDVEILMQLLAMSRRYAFRQLHRKLMTEINFRICPSSVLIIYRCAFELDIEELIQSTRLMILTWLPQIQKTQLFYNLSEKSIYDIFTAEAPEVDTECKLNALSAWWSRNKDAKVTDLWIKLITCSGE